VVIVDHDEPSHCSARVVPEPSPPTARQNVGEVQDTPYRKLLPDTLVVVIVDHDEPSHCSDKVRASVPEE
jgi:hypothetical protein